MPAYKDNNTQTWYASFYYQNWKGERIKKMKRGFRTKREADEFIAKFKLEQAKDLDMNFEEFLNTDIGSLSTGNKKKVFLITAFYLKPALLILDEPFDGLDFDATEFLYGLLLQYKEEGSILMSSHIAESIVRVCDTAYTIEDGHLDAIESNLEDWFHDVNRQRG